MTLASQNEFKSILSSSTFWNMRVVGVNCSLNVQCSSSSWRPMGLLQPEGESKKCFPYFLFVCFLHLPFYPRSHHDLYSERTTGLSGCCVSKQDPPLPNFMFHLLCQKDHAGLLLDQPLPFLPLPSILLSFPLLYHLICGPIHTLLGAQSVDLPGVLIYAVQRHLLLFMDV